jgi:cell division control protein 6
MTKQKTIWDSIEETQTIFIEKEVFTIEYIPETINHRNNQINKIIYNLKNNLNENKKPYHMIINGSYATGKTLTINYIFSEVEKKYQNVKAVHINCKNHKTIYEIYLKIYEKIFNKKNMGVGGLSTFTLLNKIIGEIIKKEITLLVALDDIGSVKSDRDLNNVLYNLLRASETDKKAKITVFSVTNDKNIVFLDDNVRTVFNGIDVEFPNYTYNEISNILSERCRLGLYKGAISNKIVEDVARYVFD